MRAFYFGCVGGPGHYWWAPFAAGEMPQKARGTGYGSTEFAYFMVDGVFCPPGREDEGPAQLVYVNLDHRAWTLLAFWDRSVDKRGGCCSVFLVEGTHGFNAAVRWARSFFPAVWARYPFTVSEWRGASNA